MRIHKYYAVQKTNYYDLEKSFEDITEDRLLDSLYDTTKMSGQITY